MVAGIDVSVDLLSPIPKSVEASIGLPASHQANNMQRDTFHLGGQSGWLRATVGTQTDGTEDCAAKHSVTGGTQTDGIGACHLRVAVTVDTETNRRIVRFVEQSDQLLPGILNEIALSEIAPKLPWSAFRTLSLVSRGWQQAVRSRDARSSESLVVLNHTCSGGESEEDWEAISLYSMRDNSCHQLPRIYLLEYGIPEYCGCASVDGKIYIMGGNIRDSSNDCEECNGAETYVLDVTGKRQWKQCASMEQKRKEFGCVVMNRKIYVFGGCTETHYPLRECEVYDPEADTWLSIQPMRSLRSGHSVTAIGEEIFVYGGYCYNDVDPADPFWNVSQSVDAYHPVRNEWRVIETCEKVTKSRLFSAQGKFFSMTCEGMSAHANDLPEDTWTGMQSFSLPQAFVVPDFPYCLDFELCPVLAVDDELLIIWRRHSSVNDAHLSLLRSKGFGSKKKEIVWEKANCSLVWDMMRKFHLPFLCPAQL